MGLCTTGLGVVSPPTRQSRSVRRLFSQTPSAPSLQSGRTAERTVVPVSTSRDRTQDVAVCLLPTSGSFLGLWARKDGGTSVLEVEPMSVSHSQCHPDRLTYAMKTCWPCYSKKFWKGTDRRKAGVWAEYRREERAMKLSGPVVRYFP